MTVNVTAEISTPTIQAEVYRATIIPEGYYKIGGTKEITENGKHNVGDYEFVDVNVPTSALNISQVENMLILR